MNGILFKGKENLSEVQDLLNQNHVEHSSRTREAFVRNGKEYPSVDLVEYTDDSGIRRVLTPGRSIGINNGVVFQKPQM